MNYGGDPRRFSTKQHPFYCGIDLHARSMDVCILSHAGDILVHRHMPAAPAPFLQAIAPYRDHGVGAVECLFTWSGLAALWAQEGMPFVLGHALSMQAIQGGKAQNDQLDSPKLAGLLRGGLLPQASVYPAAMRATRELVRRRMPLRRHRAALLAHVQPTTSPYNLPELGKQIAYKANRDGVAERFPAPAVQKRIEVELALIDADDPLLPALARPIGHTAKEHDGNPFYRLRSIPGGGTILARVRLYALHDLQRLPRGQDFVS